MRRSSLLVFMVLLVYVCVLNLVLAHVLYQRYFAKDSGPGHMSPHQTAAAGTPRRAQQHNFSRSGLAPRARCAGHDKHTDIAVRVRPLATLASNEVASAPVVTLLSALRQHLLAPGNPPVRVWLVVRPEDFVALYRLWCVALVADSDGRCSCEMLFASREQHAAIAWLVLRREECVSSLFLLDQAFALPRRLFLRHSAAPPAHVVRLDAAADTAAAPDSGAGHESLYLPACFLRACVLAVCGRGTEPQTDGGIPAIAAGAGRHACVS